jgi:hypothetical protein
MFWNVEHHTRFIGSLLEQGCLYFQLLYLFSALLRLLCNAVSVEFYDRTVVSLAHEMSKHSFCYEQSLLFSVAGPETSVVICCIIVKARNDSSFTLIFIFVSCTF